jgi:hypothetical protein
VINSLVLKTGVGKYVIIKKGYNKEGQIEEVVKDQTL